ncbi:MAG: hypothetical protein MJY58_02190 [Bacteroidaceae bacterium]|nr:hypothetical protein [Bacteroidaceae bacterium]
MKPFVQILAAALETAAAERGWQYNGNGCLLWAQAGEAYIVLALLDGMQQTVRSLQYQAREVTGSVLFDCHQYDLLVSLCLEDGNNAEVLLTDCYGRTATADLSKSLFLEMLDFLREG